MARTQGHTIRLAKLTARKVEGQSLLRQGVPLEEVARRFEVQLSTVKGWRTDMRSGYVPEPVVPVRTPRLWSQAERETPMGEW